MAVTIKDVARRAGVSISTVSRVMNGSAPVSEGKRRRVERAAHDLGYSPNPAARSLLGQTSGGIGVVLPFVGGGFFADLLLGMDQAAQRLGRHLLISTSHREPEELVRAHDRLARRVDGLIVMAPELSASNRGAFASVEGPPVVFVNTMPALNGQDTINFDNAGGMEALTDHLIDQGHRRIAFIKGPEGLFDAEERLKGYRTALSRAGLTHDPALEVEGEYTEASGFTAAQHLMELTPRPTAILAANDYSAMGAMSALRDLNLRIPDDVALAGFDDVPTAQFAAPPLTSVHVPVQDIGERAVQQVVARIHNVDASRYDATTSEVVVPVRLVLRTSTQRVVQSTS